MSLLVTGSIGIDTVESPSGKAADILGGSSIYFAMAASFFSPVRLVGVVGEDCPEGFLAPLEKNTRIDLAGLEVRPGSKTFRWHGKYRDDVNERDTVSVDLNVLAERGPSIPPQFRDSRYVFLANTHPALQVELLGQLDSPSLVVADTMDLWISGERAALMELLGLIDGLVVNDSEALLLTGESNIIGAGLTISEMVRQFVVVKKGQHGSLLFVGRKVFALPSYPVLNVVDPTGAGDSFAGAMMGYLAAQDNADEATLCRALAYGTVTASLELEDFSVNRLAEIARKDIDQRLEHFQQVCAF
ncbi:MAG: PfkB family carbohydrate kinase [Planctomycetaceae bacterium]|nr:PfkB family carbohydrate kinase [Planctomycetaceae bacterium]